jgi:preprotein translocase subunit SecE
MRKRLVLWYVVVVAILAVFVDYGITNGVWI